MDSATIEKALVAVTQPWARQRKAEEREANAVARRHDTLVNSRRVSLKDAAYEVMAQAYLEASENSRSPSQPLPPRPRMIYYRARPAILERTGLESVDGQYFSQTLLVNYMAEHPEETASWDIAWDDRGHFQEPHTGTMIGVGTLAVRQHLADIAAHACLLPSMKEWRRQGLTLDGIAAKLNAAGHTTRRGRPWGPGDVHSVLSSVLSKASGVDLSISLDAVTRFPTLGPANRYAAILFIEKEGFLSLFEAVQLAERFDLAIMSSKGLSTTAGRTLVDRLCGEHRLPLLVLHDFDKSGFSILGTLQRNTRRYSFANKIEVVSLGLRLADVHREQLQSEPVTYELRGRPYNPCSNLRENGATEEEIDFLCSEQGSRFAGQRVELNAFTSEGLIDWIERKLKKHGIKKVVPDAATLEAAYRRAAAIAAINETLSDLVEKEAAAAKVPTAIASKIAKKLRENPALPWDGAIAELADDEAARAKGVAAK